MKVPLLDLKAQYATIKDEVLAAVDGGARFAGLHSRAEGRRAGTACCRAVRSAIWRWRVQRHRCVACQPDGPGIGSGDEVITTPSRFSLQRAAYPAPGLFPSSLILNRALITWTLHKDRSRPLAPDKGNHSGAPLRTNVRHGSNHGNRAEARPLCD